MYNKSILLLLVFIFSFPVFGFDGHAQTARLMNKEASFVDDIDLSNMFDRVEDLFVKKELVYSPLKIGKCRDFYGELHLRLETNENFRIVSVMFCETNKYKSSERVKNFYKRELIGQKYHNRPNEFIYITIFVRP